MSVPVNPSTTRYRSVQKQLLMPLTLVFFLMVLAVWYLLLVQQKNALHEVANSLLYDAKSKLEKAIATQTSVLLAVERGIVNDEKIKQALQAGNREALLALSQQQFKDFQRQLNITHFYFHDAGQVNLLRLHHPEHFGDLIQRETLRKSKLTGRSVAGLELGIFGTFTLRVVRPIFLEATLIGFVELGIEIEDLTKHAVKAENTEWMVVIDKRSLQEDDWRRGMTLLGREADWQLLNRTVLSATSMQALPAQWLSFIDELPEEGATVVILPSSWSTSWAMATVNLADAQQRNVGHLLVFYNISENKQALRQRMVFSVVLLVLLMLLLLFSLYLFLRRVNKNITSNRKALQLLANHDVLTGLANRKFFQERLSHALVQHRRQGASLALIFMDLDNFKGVNDIYGHSTGDNLLVAVTDRLMDIVRKGDTFCRLGGDEFVIIVEHLQAGVDARVVAEKLIQAFERPFSLESVEIAVSTSIGISVYPQDGDDGEMLLRNADSAMYRAKDAGRNRYVFYTSQITADLQQRFSLEKSFLGALDDKQLHLSYQPQYDVASGAVVGLEALCRWTHPELGNIPPSDFIPIAEQSGLIHKLGFWVIRVVCEQGRAWLDEGLEFGRLSVNLSYQQLQHVDLHQYIIDTLQSSGFPASRLEIEVTESTLMENIGDTVEILAKLKDQGCSIALDDFGTGYSSLSYLKRLPIDVLKIDRSFIKGIPEDQEDKAIVAAIVALAQSIHVDIIVEGVESRAQLDFLTSINCRVVQGFYFSKPVPADEARLLLHPISVDGAG